MNLKRAWTQFRMLTIPTGVKRADYLRKRKVFGSIGNLVMIQPRKIPLYPENIFIGNNVRLASGVSFITHDVVHNMLNNLYPAPVATTAGLDRTQFKEKRGKIIIGDNVFIGANTLILYDVAIGSNVIIGAGSVVTKDIPDGTVCAGVPCRRIGDFDSFVKKRMKQ